MSKDLRANYFESLRDAIAKLPEDEKQKLYQTTWQQSAMFSHIGQFQRSGISVEQKLEDAKSQIKHVVYDRVQALQIIDLAYVDEIEEYADRLNRLARHLRGGYEAERMIEILTQDLRHEPESFEEMIESVEPKRIQRIGDWKLTVINWK